MKRAFSLTEAIVIVAILFAVLGISWPVVSRPRPSRGTLYCGRNLKQIGLGFIQYSQDYDEKLPPVRFTSAKGWADGIFPYVKSWQMFDCPGAVRLTVAPKTVSLPRVDYFYNRRLAGLDAGLGYTPGNPISGIIMAGDGPVNGTPWPNWGQLPTDATTNITSPAQRHPTNALVGGGNAANYLFIDGHVKLLKPDQILNSAGKPDSLEPTFAVR